MFISRVFWAVAFAVSILVMAGFQAAPYQPKAGETVMALNVEGKGEVVIKLHMAQAPQACKQIVKLTEQGFYNNQKFFRVITEPRPFLVQFGDPQSKQKPMGDSSLGKGGSGVKVPYEDSGLSNTEGAVGLSTPTGNKDAGDSQFYINLTANRFLDGNYTVFGQVVKGMDVVKALKLGDLVTSATIKRG